jgi:hypothetical protein
MAVKTTSFKYSLGGGQFEPDLPGQFAPDLGGQLRPERGGHIERIFHCVHLTLQRKQKRN